MKPQKLSAATLICLAFGLLVFISPNTQTAQGQQVQVTAADPPSAEQGTINLNVKITGKGFKKGAAANFFVTGTTDTGGVRVNATAFVHSGELTANIDVADTATIANFDIQVLNSDGRGGKGTELFSVTQKGVGQSGDTLARADFRDFGVVGSAPGSAVDRIQSDGTLVPALCGPYDYADFNDPCQPGHRGVSEVSSVGTYFLRTTATQEPHPTRYLVLDFTERLDGSSCPGLDTLLKNYPGRDPNAFSPENPDPCVDWLEVRFSAGDAFAPGAQITGVNMLIDGPDLIVKRNTQYTQWNAKYCLNFVNPLTITPDPGDPNSETLTTNTGLEQVELRTFNAKTGKCDTLLGRYLMPFQVRVTKLVP